MQQQQHAQNKVEERQFDEQPDLPNAGAYSKTNIEVEFKAEDVEAGQFEASRSIILWWRTVYSSGIM